LIARLIGTLADKRPGRVVVDVGGVGYELTVPLSTYYDLGESGSRVELHVHTHVREDALLLFGFRTGREKDLFARLISVTGVGPKIAIAVLSSLGPDDLASAVRRRDVATLAKIPGIGRKTAERVVLELADRLEPPAGPVAAPGGAPVRDDLISALVNLGYNARVAADAADRALQGAGGSEAVFETLLRQSLKSLSR